MNYNINKKEEKIVENCVYSAQRLLKLYDDYFYERKIENPILETKDYKNWQKYHMLYVDYFFDFPPAAQQSLKWKIKNIGRYIKYYIRKWTNK